MHKVIEARSEASSEDMALRMLSLAVVGLDSQRKSRFLCYPFSVPQCQCLCETSRIKQACHVYGCTKLVISHFGLPRQHNWSAQGSHLCMRQGSYRVGVLQSLTFWLRILWPYCSHIEVRSQCDSAQTVPNSLLFDERHPLFLRAVLR